MKIARVFGIRQLTAAALLLMAGQAASGAVLLNSQYSPSQTAFAASATDAINTGQPYVTSATYKPGTGDPGEFNWLTSARPDVLTNGITGGAGDSTQGVGNEAVPIVVTYNLNTALSPAGYHIDAIDVIAAWPADSRIPSRFTVFFTTVSNPTLTQLGGTFSYNGPTPAPAGGATLVTLRDSSNGPLSDGVNTLIGVNKLEVRLTTATGLGIIYRELDVFIPEPSCLGALAMGGLVLLRRRR